MSLYSNFLTNKQNLESEINKFKSISEHFDTTSDPSYVYFNNIDLSVFDSFVKTSETDCKALCSTDTHCVAYAFLDGSCNKYTSIDDNFNSGSDTLFLKKNNVDKFGYYLINTNNAIISNANSIKNNLDNYDSSNNYYYDGTNGDKEHLDSNFNALQETKKKYNNLIVSNETNMDPIVVNTYYFRYLFLFTLMFIMLITFIYFAVNNTSNIGSNFILYLALFIIVFSVSIIYILK